MRPRSIVGACVLLGALLAPAAPALAARPLDLPSRTPLLFALQAERGSLERVGRSRDRFVLTLRGLPSQGIWFADRPTRDSGHLPLRGLFADWRRLGFRADPPNAVLSVLEGRRRTDALAVTLRAPRYDARRRTVRFRVRTLRDVSQGLRHLRHRIDVRIPARFRRAALFVDDATLGSGNTVGQCSQQAQLDLFPASLPTPSAYMPTNGWLLPIAQHAAIWELLSTRYGGDGLRNFALPRTTAPPNLRWDLCSGGPFPVRDDNASPLCVNGALSLQAQTYQPGGWLPADGRTLPVGFAPGLAEALGTRFGGDGSSTFGLPSVPDQDGMKWYVCANGERFRPTWPTPVDCNMSQLSLFATDGLPSNYLPADGRVLEIGAHRALSTLLGNVFGGDGVDTFALPNLPGPAPGTTYGVCSAGVFPSPS